MNLLFRVDCNSKTGFGHFSRCLNLARTFKHYHQGVNITFVGNYNGFSLNLLRFYNIKCESIELDDFSIVFPSIVDCFDLIFLDTYLLSEDRLDSLRGISERLVFIDDSGVLDYNGFFCVINFRHNAQHLFKYQSQHSLLGSQYLIIKPELTSVRNKKNIFWQFFKTLLFTGGTPLNEFYLSNVMEFLSRFAPQTVVTHVGNPSLSHLSYNNYINVSPSHDIEDHLVNTDVAVNTGGLFKYESSYCCIPTASFSTTALQATDSQILATAGLHADLGSILTFDPLNPPTSLTRFVDDSVFRTSLVSTSISKHPQIPTLKLVTALCHLI